MGRIGFAEADLGRLLEYAHHADVTITFDPEKAINRSRPTGAPLVEGSQVIDALLVHPAYLNQFETGISGGSLSSAEGGIRDEAERRLFAGAYHNHPLVPQERPRYGVLNLPNVGYGGGGTQYGDCYFVLKDELKSRMTFTPDDSMQCKPETLGTRASLEHVLNAISDEDLKMITEVALGQRERGTRIQRNEFGYVEAQIHGPIEYERDVERLVAAARYRGTETGDKIRAFAAKNGIELIWHAATTEFAFGPTGASTLVDVDTFTPDGPSHPTSTGQR